MHLKIDSGHFFYSRLLYLPPGTLSPRFLLTPSKQWEITHLPKALFFSKKISPAKRGGRNYVSQKKFIMLEYLIKAYGAFVKFTKIMMRNIKETFSLFYSQKYFDIELFPS